MTRQQRLDLARQLWCQGVHAREIGEQVGYAEKTVANYAAKYGWGCRVRRPTMDEIAQLRLEYEAGDLPLADLAEKYRMSSGTIQGYKRRYSWNCRHQAWTPERIQRAVDMYVAGTTQYEIASVLGSSQGKVSKYIRQAGIETRDARYVPGQNAGSKNPAWKGGRQVDKSGYVLLWVPDHPDSNNNGYVREHRLVMEQVLGRRLLPAEVVHHRNGIPGDNRPGNLELFATNADHLRHELTGRVPNWTPEGRERILAAARRPRKRSSSSSRPKSDALGSPRFRFRFPDEGG